MCVFFFFCKKILRGKMCFWHYLNPETKFFVKKIWQNSKGRKFCTKIWTLSEFESSRTYIDQYRSRIYMGSSTSHIHIIEVMYWIHDFSDGLLPHWDAPMFASSLSRVFKERKANQTDCGDNGEWCHVLEEDSYHTCEEFSVPIKESSNPKLERNAS